MKIVRAKTQTAVIPTASMADIAFLLIIFFMVTTVYDVDPETWERIPDAVTALPSASRGIEVADDGSYRFIGLDRLFPIWPQHIKT